MDLYVLSDIYCLTRAATSGEVPAAALPAETDKLSFHRHLPGAKGTSHIRIKGDKNSIGGAILVVRRRLTCVTLTKNSHIPAFINVEDSTPI